MGSTTVTLFFTFTFLVLLLILSLRRQKRYKLPPGPRKLPIIGSLHYMLSSHPHVTLRDLALKHGPLMHLQLGRVPNIIASDPRIAKEIMKSHDSVFGNRPVTTATRTLAYGCNDVAFSPSNASWRQARKICAQEVFAPTRVQSFVGIREEEVLSMLRGILSEGPGPVNMSHKLASLTNDIVARICFRKKRWGDQRRILELMKLQVELLGGFSVGDYWPWLGIVDVISGRKGKMDESKRELDQILEVIIEAHTREDEEEEEEEDLVDVLLRIQKDGNLDVPLTTNHVKAILWDMFIAGTETSSTVMEWAMSELMRNPRVLEKAQKEVREVLRGKLKVEECDITKLNYLKLIIKETLRLHPPFPLLGPRESMEGCMLEGYEIPPKSTVLINAWAMSKSTNYWENPEIFEPERFSDGMIDFKGQNFEFIPFGAGRRGCPGIFFGLSMIDLALAELLFYFDWKLPNGMKAKDLDMSESYGIAVPRKTKLDLIPLPHFPLPI